MKIRDTSGQDQPIQNRSQKRTWIIVTSVAAILLMIYLAAPSFARWNSVSGSVSSDRLRFATVERGPFVRDVLVRGRVVAAVSPTLYSPAEGNVYLSVNAGDLVEQGQIIARIDSPALSSRLQQETATLEATRTEFQRLEIDSRTRQLAQRKRFDDAKVALKAADREQRRAALGYDKGVYGQIDYEKAQDTLETAQLEFDHANAETELLNDAIAFELQTQRSAVDRQQLVVEELQRQVANLEIRSPVNGVTGDVLVGERAWVDANQALMSVVDLQAFELDVDIPETYADALAPRIPTEIRIGQETHAGVLSAISPEVNNNQVSGRVRFAAETPQGLRQNQRLSVRIVLDEKADALVVRRGPFFDSGAGKIAYVVGADGVAQRRAIVTGAISVDSVEILSGLEVGDRIVISNINSFEGQDRVLLNP